MKIRYFASLVAVAALLAALYFAFMRHADRLPASDAADQSIVPKQSGEEHSSVQDGAAVEIGHRSFRPYEAKTLQEARLAASRAGATIDDIAAKQYAEDICRSAAMLSRSSQQINVAEAADATASEGFLLAFGRSFCRDFVPGAMPLARDRLQELVAVNSDEAMAVIEARELLDSNQSDKLAGSASKLAEIMRTTRSPYVFMTAGHVLQEAQSRASDSVSSNPLQQPLDSASVDQARQFGVLLATCRRFSICGPQSMLSIRTCVPNRCEAGGTVQSYVTRQLSPEALEEAQRYSSTLKETP